MENGNYKSGHSVSGQLCDSLAFNYFVKGYYFIFVINERWLSNQLLVNSHYPTSNIYYFPILAYLQDANTLALYPV